MEGLPYDGADGAVRAGADVEDDRRIDVRRLVDMDAGLFNLVDFVARFHAEVVGNDDRILGGESNGEGLGLLHVVRSRSAGPKPRSWHWARRFHHTFQ